VTELEPAAVQSYEEKVDLLVYIKSITISPPKLRNIFILLLRDLILLYRVFKPMHFYSRPVPKFGSVFGFGRIVDCSAVIRFGE
jgi:hypothetical protein